MPSGSTNLDGFLADWEDIYNTTHPKRGKLLILNNETFRPSLELKDRKGTDVDAANLYDVFKGLGFDVDVQNNVTAAKMLQDVSKIASEDHSKEDCFAMAILSHGGDGGLIYGTDAAIDLDRLIQPLKGNGCSSLIGKPKIVFIQACRGNEFDEGTELKYEIEHQDDGDVFSGQTNERTFKIPSEADFFYAYSTPPGHYAFRNAKDGSWFIQAISKVFKEYGTRFEINQLMTRVNKKVAYDFESKSKIKAFNAKKQVSSSVSMLTKELYFPQKES